MLIQSQSGNRLRSRPASRLHARTHALTDLTSLATFCLSISPIQGITVHSASSGPSISSTHHKPGEAVP